MRPLLKLYLGLVITLAVVVLVGDLAALGELPSGDVLAMLVVLSLACVVFEQVTFHVHSGWVTAGGTVPHIAAAFLLPPGLAELAAVVGSVSYYYIHRRPLSKAAFNVASLTLTVATAAHLVQAFGGRALLSSEAGLLGPGVAVLGTLAYNVISVSSVAGAVALDQRRSLWDVLRGKLSISTVAEVTLGLLGATLASLQTLAPTWLLGLLPAAFLLFLSWRAIDRAERRSRNLTLTSAVGRAVAETRNHDVAFRAITAVNVRDDLRLEGLGLLPLRDPPAFEPAGVGSVPVHHLAHQVLSRMRQEPAVVSLTSAGTSGDGAPPARPMAAVGVPFGPDPAQPIGALVGWRLSPDSRPAAFTPEEILVFSTLADYATVALESERLLQESSEAEALRQLAQLKDEFLSQVSHELRTPLTIIYGFSELIVKGRLKGDAARDSIEQIYESSKVMLRLVEDLLDTARVESGRLSLRREVTDLAPWLARLAESFAAAHQSHSFSTQVPESLPRCNVDLERFAQVMHNLLSNAVRYSPRGSIITVRARPLPRGAGLEILVADQGVGIPDDDRERIFEKFYRGEQGESLAFRGAGIGLAVARALVEAHHGEIGVESTLGAGSTFWIRLPAALSTGDQPVLAENTAASAPVVLSGA